MPTASLPSAASLAKRQTNMVETIIASTVSPTRIEAYYNENKDRFYQEDSVKLRLIQVARAPQDNDDTLKAMAATVMNELNAGADFGDLARKTAAQRG